MSISDINDILSTTTPLNAGQSFTSKPVNVGLYRSINVCSVSDSRGKVFLYFSATGKPGSWDTMRFGELFRNSKYAHTYKVENLWCYVVFQNTDSVNETYRRSFCFCGDISLSNDIYEQGVLVHNLQMTGSGDTLISEVSKLIPNTQYKLSLLPYQTKTNLTGVPFKKNILFYTAETDVVESNIQYATGDSLSVYSPLIIGFGRFISKVVYPSCRDKSLEFQMVMNYGTPGVISNSYNIIGFGVPLSSTSRGFSNGVFMYSGLDSNIGIAYWRNGVETRVPQSQFNVDRLDGTGRIHALQITKLINFKIEVSNCGEVTFLTFNPRTQFWNIFHKIFDLGTTTQSSLISTNFHVLVQSETLNPSVQDDIKLFSVGVRITSPIIRSLNRTMAIIPRTLTNVMSPIFAISTTTRPWILLDTVYPSFIKLKRLRVTNPSSSVVNFAMYKDAVLSATVFTAVVETNMTYSSPGGTVSTWAYAKQYYILPNSSQTIDCDSELNWEEVISFGASLMTNDIQTTLYMEIIYDEYF